MSFVDLEFKVYNYREIVVFVYSVIVNVVCSLVDYGGYFKLCYLMFTKL